MNDRAHELPPLVERLARPERIERQLERLVPTHARARRKVEVKQRGVPLARLLEDRPATARKISAALRDRTYAPQPARARVAYLDKKRILFALEAVDLVVHGVVADALNEAVAHRLSECVYSYRAGHSSWGATSAVAEYVRDHAARTPVRERGVHLFRADIANYAPSIPNHDGAPLWDRLRDGLAPRDTPEDAWAFEVVRGVVRPPVVFDDQPPQPLPLGMPVGSPMCTAVLNWFLDPLDKLLEPNAPADGLYARYGDDILVVHERYDEVVRRRESAEAWLEQQGLALKAEKWQLVYFNGAGRPSPDDPSLPGTTAVEYLGMRIDFKGTQSMSNSKRKRALVDLRDRLRQSARLLANRPLEQRGRVLVDVANEFITANDAVQGAYMDWVFTRTTDREQLKQMDYDIARAVVAQLVGHGGAKGFRVVSWRQLRAWGLISLVDARNKGWRAASKMAKAKPDE